MKQTISKASDMAKLHTVFLAVRMAVQPELSAKAAVTSQYSEYSGDGSLCWCLFFDHCFAVNWGWLL